MELMKPTLRALVQRARYWPRRACRPSVCYSGMCVRFRVQYFVQTLELAQLQLQV
jgi:hypothetical protein